LDVDRQVDQHRPDGPSASNETPANTIGTRAGSRTQNAHFVTDFAIVSMSTAWKSSL